MVVAVYTVIDTLGNVESWYGILKDEFGDVRMRWRDSVQGGEYSCMLWGPFHFSSPSVAGISVFGVAFVDSFLDFYAVECHNVAHSMNLEVLKSIKRC